MVNDLFYFDTANLQIKFELCNFLDNFFIGLYIVQTQYNKKKKLQYPFENIADNITMHDFISRCRIGQ